MQLYLDESGNLGRSGKYFVIACLRPGNPKRIRNLIRRCCVKHGENGSPLEEIKGSLLGTDQKQDVINRLKRVDDFSCSYIIAEKKFIERKLLDDNNLAYNYLCSYLFKPIIKSSSEDIDVILDNHNVKVNSLNSLQDYIKLKAIVEWDFNKNIKFEYQDSKRCRNLQAVDLISNVVYGKYTYGTNHLFNLLGNSIKHKIEFPYNKFEK